MNIICGAKAPIFGVSGFVGLMGLEMPVRPFFESRNGTVTACTPAIKSHFRISLVDHFTHIQCTVTEEAITSTHDAINHEDFILQLLSAFQLNLYRFNRLNSNNEIQNE